MCQVLCDELLKLYPQTAYDQFFGRYTTTRHDTIRYDTTQHDTTVCI